MPGPGWDKMSNKARGVAMAKAVKKATRARGAHLIRGISPGLMRQIEWHKVQKGLASRNEAILDLLKAGAPALPPQAKS